LTFSPGYVHTNIVKLLLEFGADPEAADKNGRTVLDLATELLEKTPKMNPMMFGRRIALDQVTRRTSLLLLGSWFGSRNGKAENVLLSFIPDEWLSHAEQRIRRSHSKGRQVC
jgi:hypothetical protein